jgi:AcrR family transcriptional regulator
MGIKERREREKQITRQGILTAARRIAQQEGWPALTVRKVAESIEYSPPMIYEYFANKEEILLELMREGFRQLTVAMQQARDAVEDCEERLFKIVDAYWSFANNNPDLYQIMNGLGGVPLDIQETARAGRDAGIVPLAALEDWAQCNAVALEDALGATETAWGLIHGMVSLTMVDRIEGGEPRARLLLHQAVQALLLAWKVNKKGP